MHLWPSSAFSPQLVAGPIERAKNLLPQFHIKTKFSYNLAKDGLHQMLWGFIKKVIVADTCAIGVNYIYKNYEAMSGVELILGAVLFSFQIYGDFSGYSDIAIGTSKLFGFKLTTNFSLPYFSRNIAEFWKRWHISLSSWFQDYVYIPLGGNREGKNRTLINIIITFTLSGLWHGASWNYVVWGLINGILFIPLFLFGRSKKHTSIIAENSMFPTIREAMAVAVTFVISTFTWIFFRAESLTHALGYIKNIIYKIDVFTVGNLGPVLMHSFKAVVMILILVIIEWFQRKNSYQFKLDGFPKLIRYGVYYLAIFAIFYYSTGEHNFIYFQF